MRLISAVSMLMACAIASVPAMGQEIAKQFGGGEAIQVDPAKAYITFRLLQKSPIRFLRIPTDEERSAYAKERDEAFAKEHARNPKVEMGSFQYPPVETRNFINSEFGPVFDRQDGLLVYVIAVKPGTYVLYGAIWPDQDGVSEADTCFCMGSVKFEALAGKITNIGRIRLSDDWGGTPPPANPAGRIPFALLPPDNGGPATGHLAGLPVVAADFHAVGKMPNYKGVLIDRLSPIPGVLGYDRDQIIDLKSGTVMK